MVTGKQLAIFAVLAKRPFAEYTRKEIKKEAKEKSNNALALAIHAFKKEGVLVEKKIGRTGLLTLNLDKDITFYYIALSADKNIPPLAKQALGTLNKEIIQNTPFFATVIFGSYAVGRQKKDSDLDIAIFIENKERKKKIEAAARSAQLKSTLEMDIQIISKAEMLEMLARDEENLGKQIARKHLAAYNPRIFYEIIKNGMKHGFRI